MTDYAELEKRLRERSQTVCVAHGIFTESFITPDALCTEAADAISALTRELEEAKEARVKANNQWRLDYIEMAGNAELFQETVIALLRPYAPRRSLTDLSGQRIADFLCRYDPAYAQEHGLSTAPSDKDSEG